MAKPAFHLLVTGGCGFIGSHFVRWALKEHTDWRVINLDALTYSGNPDVLKEFESNPQHQFVQADIRDQGGVEKALEGVDAIVHFAAETHVDRSIEEPQVFLNTNILGTHVLLEAARQKGIKKFVHMSTDEVYGSLKTGSADEEHGLAPNSPYAASKAAADLLIRSYWVTYQYPVTIVRCSNNFGSFQFPEKVIPLFITNLIEGKKVPLYGEGLNRREWIHVEDTCRAIDHILKMPPTFDVYNIKGATELTNRQLTGKILEAMGHDENMIQPVADRPGHDLRYSVNGHKLEETGFSLRYSFDEALRKTVEWYLANRLWWQARKKDKFTNK